MSSSGSEVYRVEVEIYHENDFIKILRAVLSVGSSYLTEMNFRVEFRVFNTFCSCLRYVTSGII